MIPSSPWAVDKIIAGDPVHARALVNYVATMNVAFGLLVFAIDLKRAWRCSGPSPMPIGVRRPASAC